MLKWFLDKCARHKEGEGASTTCSAALILLAAVLGFVHETPEVVVGETLKWFAWSLLLVGFSVLEFLDSLSRSTDCSNRFAEAVCSGFNTFLWVLVGLILLFGDVPSHHALVLLCCVYMYSKVVNRKNKDLEDIWGNRLGYERGRGNEEGGH